MLGLVISEDRRLWESINRLHEKELITDPVNKAKSVLLTEEGLLESERLFRQLISKKQ